MKKRLFLPLLLVFCLTMLTACTDTQDADLSSSEIEITTELWQDFN